MNLSLPVLAALKKTQQDGTNRSRKDVKRLLYLRPSGFRFNYCQLRTFFACREALHGSTHELMDFSKSFFTKVGTTTHDVWQEAMYRAGVECLYDWVCERCQTRYRMRPSIKGCSTCRKEGVKTKPKFRREEVEIDYLGVLGHIDVILKLQDENGDYYIVVDLKSTSAAGLSKKKNDPGEDYLAQIQTYTRVLLDQGWPVRGWALAFFTRDNPYKYEVVSGSDVRITTSQIKRWGKLHQQVLRATTFKQVRAFVDTRVCRSKEDVEKKMGSCPHAVKCIHGDSACLKHAKADYKVMKDRMPVIEWLRQERS